MTLRCRRWVLVAGLILGCVDANHADEKLTRYSTSQPHMGAVVTITCFAPDSKVALAATTAAFQRIEALNSVMSDYDPSSELMRLCINSKPGQQVTLSRDLATVLDASLRMSRDSEGAFDVSVGPIVRLWRRARRRKEFPPSDLLATARASIGYQAIQLDSKNLTVSLSKPNMRLDLGGIAKGYAADEALKVLRAHGIDRALVDAGGDLSVGDPPPEKAGWVIGVQELRAETQAPEVKTPNTKPATSKAKQYSQRILVRNCGVATSGDAFQFVVLNGKRYSHIVDPRTGIALERSSSVTVIAPNGMQADALASAVSVMGPKAGLALIAKQEQTAALVMQLSGTEFKSWMSTGFRRYVVTASGANRHAS
ncbi:MAG: FAD:protein FMN transferase [Planctomycetota bacterium]|nr:FAD:protein FMN transferase [Planctomycetota bacterium]